MVKKILLILLSVVLVVACFTMTACKETPTYTITFDVDGGSAVSTQKVEKGEKASKPVDPTKVGYEFDNWYLGEEQTPFDFENTSINKSITLKAKWNINQYSITFDSDGGTPVDTITQDYDTAVSASVTTTKTGYEFLGWFEEGSTDAYVFTTIEARNVELKAKWNINQYSITFDSDGGTPVDTITQDYDTAVSAPTNPTKTGYIFTGWYEDSVIPYEFNRIEARNVSLKAGWDLDEYSISFDTDGGLPTIDTITQDYGTSVVAPAQPSKTGYTFIGWFEEGSNDAYVFTTIEARNVELKAKWEINQYSISFDTDGGLPTIDTLIQNYGTSVVAPEQPTKPGFNFLGWFEEGSNVAYVFNTIEARNVELKAKWGETQEYSITFNSDGGSPVATIIDNAGMPVSAPANPTKTGYTFVGWFEDGETSAYVFNVIEERNVALTAKWDINQYSITFDTDGGEPATIDTITQDYDTEILAPANPTRDGYVFLGWFEEDSSVAYAFNRIEARNVELKAKWGEIRGIIILDKNMDGQFVGGFTQDKLTPYITQEITLPEITCFGYKFLGWKNKSTGEMLEKVDGEYKIIHDGNDVEYQAQWEKIYQGSDTV